MNAKKITVFDKLRAFLSSYCHFADEQITVPLSFWIAATYIFEAFDSFSYLVITAKTKRSGKTRLSELIGFTCNMPFACTGATAAALFRKVKDDKPTILWDEAESLGSESKSVMRQFLNAGYRKGQVIPRATGEGVIEWPCYCPKVFILIGDVFDTLRDRSIIIEMKRGEPGKRFMYETAKAEGLEIADELRAELSSSLPIILAKYQEIDLPFLTDRDEEIWRSIFAIASVLDPQSVKELQRIAADLAAEKSNPYRYVENKEADSITATEEFGRIALRDLVSVLRNVNPTGRKSTRALSVNECVEELKKIPTSPWRKFYSPSAASDLVSKGQYNETQGLKSNQLPDLLRPFGIPPAKLIRRGKEVFRGYNFEEIEKAAKEAKII